MSKENRHQETFTDAWLNEALRLRAAAEPRPGLELRILARLAAERPAETPFYLRWMVGAAAASALLLLALAGWDHVRPKPAPAAPITAITRPHPAVVSPVANDYGRHTPIPKASTARKLWSPTRSYTRKTAAPPVAEPSAQALPKLERFPAESPATGQEKLLAEIVRRHNSANLVEYARDFRGLYDLRIEPNFIAPLSSETADVGPNR